MNTRHEQKTRIIEFIGPPGVGKSTIYKALCQKWNTQANWTYQDQLLLIEKPLLSDPKIWLEFQLRKLAKKIGNRNINVDFGLRFVDNNKPLVEFLWDHIAFSNAYNPDEAGNKFRSAYFLFKDFCRYQAIWESKSSRPCIIDEGLFVKSFFILDNKQAIADVVNSYFPLVNLPHAVVYINTSHTEIIADRLLNRKKIIASHIGKERNALLADTLKWQFLFSLIIDKLDRLSVPVFHIDALKSVEENVILLGKLLNSKCKVQVV
jgi:GTPase SAR1 family protein